MLLGIIQLVCTVQGKQWKRPRRSGVFFVIFEQILLIRLVFSFLTLNKKYMQVGM